MTTLTMNDRCDRLDAAIREGRLIRDAWTEGHDRVCLLAALSPEAAEAKSSLACPAEVCPRWVAELTPWIDDAGSLEAWPEQVKRFASLARRWHVLTPEAWQRLDYRCRLAALLEARTHAGSDPKVLAAIDGVVTQIRAAIDGRDVNKDQWAAAARAVREASASAARAARAAAAWAAASSASAAASAASSDRVISAVLDAFEFEIECAERGRAA